MYLLRRGFQDLSDHMGFWFWTKAPCTVAVAVMRSVANGIMTAATGVL